MTRFSPLFRGDMRRLTTLIATLVLLASQAVAEDLALVITDTSVSDEGAHARAIEALAETGYTVFDALDPSRADMIDLAARVEASASDRDRLVIRLALRRAEAAGSVILLPAGADPQSDAGIVAAGVPLALFLDLAAARPGRSAVFAVGRGFGPRAPGVFTATGPITDLDSLLLGPMLIAGLSVDELPPTGSVATRTLGVGALRLTGAVAPVPDSAEVGVSVDELATWRIAEDTDLPSAYRRYLENFPRGRFAAAAEARLAELEAAEDLAEQVARNRAGEAALELTAASVAVLEQRLARLGYDPGAADGRIDRQTRQSVAEFQARANLTPTGYFNTATVQQLIMAGG